MIPSVLCADRMAGCRGDAEPPVDHPKDVVQGERPRGIRAQSEESDKNFQRGSPIVEFPAAVPPLSLALLCFRLRGRLLAIDKKRRPADPQHLSAAGRAAGGERLALTRRCWVGSRSCISVDSTFKFSMVFTVNGMLEAATSSFTSPKFDEFYLGRTRRENVPL